MFPRRDYDVTGLVLPYGFILFLFTRKGRRRGVEAVVDKDLTSAVLAEQIGADLLIILTDVAGVVAAH